MYVYLTNFVKSGKGDDAKREALEHWRERNKKWLDRDSKDRNGRDARRQQNCTRQRRDQRGVSKVNRLEMEANVPKEVARLYCRRLEMEIDDMVDQMDWRFFAECSRDSDLGYVRYASDYDGSGSDDE